MPEAPVSSTAVRAVRVSFSGPLPPPRLLAQYNDAVADGAERIVKLTENQALHRQVLEVRAQIFTFVLALIGLLGGIGLIALGNSIEGLVALVAAIAGLGGVFVVRALLVHRGEKALIDG
jgi:uncharacterized membrane protein